MFVLTNLQEKEKRKSTRQAKRVAALPEILESVAEEDEEAGATLVEDVPQERSEEASKGKAPRGVRKTRTQRKVREAEPAAEIGSEEASSPPARRNKRVTRASKRKQEEASVSVSTVDVIKEDAVYIQNEEAETQPAASKPRRGRPPKKGTKPKASNVSKGRSSKKKQESATDKSQDNKVQISDDLPSVKEDVSLKKDECMMEEHGPLLEEETLTKEVTPASKMPHHTDDNKNDDFVNEEHKGEDGRDSMEQVVASNPPISSVSFPCPQQDEKEPAHSPSPLPENKVLEKDISEYKDEQTGEEVETLHKPSTASDWNRNTATPLESPLCQNNDAKHETMEHHINDAKEVIETSCQPQSIINPDEAIGIKEAVKVDDKSSLDGMHIDSPKSLDLPENEKGDYMIKNNNEQSLEEISDSEPSFSHKIESAISQGQEKGFAANLVSSLKTFLPSKLKEPPQLLSKKTAKVKALEAANAARKREEEKAAERARQKAELEQIRQERLKAKAEAEKEEARRREELQRKKEQEIAARRRAREEAEKREKEEKARRLEEHKRRRKMEAEAAAGSANPSGKQSSVLATSGSKSLAEAKERLAKIQQQAAMLKNQGTVQSNASESAKPTSSVQFKTETIDKSLKVPSYEISPYKSDFESDDDVPKKPVPDWARGKALVGQLMAQMYIDPDEVFQQHAKTCSLDEVFASCRRSVHQDFNKRSSSGNWIEDRVTWKEELSYKKAMGYI